MRKMKQEIWAGHDKSYSRTNNNNSNRLKALNYSSSTSTLLPIVIPYSNIAVHRVCEWRYVITNYSYFANRRFVAAYTKHRNLQQILGNKC